MLEAPCVLWSRTIHHISYHSGAFWVGNGHKIIEKWTKMLKLRTKNIIKCFSMRRINAIFIILTSWSGLPALTEELMHFSMTSHHEMFDSTASRNAPPPRRARAPHRVGPYLRSIECSFYLISFFTLLKQIIEEKSKINVRTSLP